MVRRHYGHDALMAMSEDEFLHWFGVEREIDEAEDTRRKEEAREARRKSKSVRQ